MKIIELRKIIRQKKCNFALFYNSEKPNPNMQYFTGYNGAGILVVPRNKTPFIMAPQMEFERARKSLIKKIFQMEKKKFFDSAYETIRNHGKAKNIAIDNNNFTLNSFKAFKKSFGKPKTHDISLSCIKLREIKTQIEIEYLKKSCFYADKILQKSINNLKSFRTEAEAAAFLDYETKKLGLELSFDPIVASGKNASMPHHNPENQKINKGFCVLDFGVKYKGYCSDITRTVYLGKPSKKEKEIYHMLLKIQEGAIDEVKHNKRCRELYDFVVKGLGDYSKYFTHGLGHGVGIEIHEMPNITLNSKDRIKNNMVFTIEPGIYISKKLGIRIEDTILFRNKTESLTKTSKDLLII